MLSIVDQIVQMVTGVVTVGAIFLAGFMCGFGTGRDYDVP
jgi:hypothetical protein